MIRGIGINCGDEVIDGHLDRLERELARVQQAGFDAYEFSAVAFSVIRNGQINQAQLDRVKGGWRALLYAIRFMRLAPCG